MHQDNVKRIIFENCEITDEKAKLFKTVLSDPTKPLIFCSFEQNSIGDAGLDHII